MDTERLVNLAKTHAAVDYGSTASVRAGNNVAREIRTVLLFALRSSDGANQVIELLSNAMTAPWAAYAALEHGILTEFQRAQCLSVVRSIATGDSVDATGAKAWLAQHGPDRLR